MEAKTKEKRRAHIKSKRGKNGNMVLVLCKQKRNGNGRCARAQSEKAKYNRKYPPLKRGDSGRVYVKKTVLTKRYDPRCSRVVYKVLFVSEDGKRYLLDNNTKKLYSRHELRKVEATETKDS